ncbi:hypothetical protein NF27_DP02080 [Candidatus Jidaibacter acanthamoeba]|uniref:Flagellar biosynthesis protein FlhB n=1 Tax=Candidatus Jidaibacter acanthamoebae TaxID=86105 RepID=A0A0C1QJG3_9RICK|nr:hypothetical protein [Candidatus Jidaibacter acanthamoeba]KIE05664.1 hypothetical protein NF27_DP02080 [Candidatus Jidaibacter acanthamoeba]
MQANKEELKALITITLKYAANEGITSKSDLIHKDEIVKAILKKAKESGINMDSDKQSEIISDTLRFNDYLPAEAYITAAKILAFILKKDR